MFLSRTSLKFAFFILTLPGQAFGPFVSDDKKTRIEAVVSQRTFDFALVLDGLYDVGNVAATIRTADGFGVTFGCASARLTRAAAPAFPCH